MTKMMQKPRGTQDFFGEKIKMIQYIEAKIKEITAVYDYQEIRTPMFEAFELFQRGVGETTDVVSKEMYDFLDKKQRKMVLKPESTAAVVRALIENKLYLQGEYQKFYYISPHFRYERAQAGRYRQHHQFGIEIFGAPTPYIDAEVILFMTQFYERVGLKNYRIHINSLGDTQSRLAHKTALLAYFRPYLSELCQDCQIRYEKNPLRLLDCKKDAQHPAMKDAPKLRAYLSPDAEAYFQKTLDLLDAFAVPYTIDDNLVRGLDYYTHTVFEIILADAEGTQRGSLGGGGRYNGLVHDLGGPELSGMGCGIGMERLMLALEEQALKPYENDKLRIFVACLDDKAKMYGFTILETLRKNMIISEGNQTVKSMKALFKQAEKFGAHYILFIGEEEMNQKVITMKDLSKKEQVTINFSELLNTLTDNSNNVKI